MRAADEGRPAGRVAPLHAHDLAATAGDSADLFPDEAWSEAAVGRLLETPGCFALAARDGARAIGLVLARTVADECEILWIVVTPARRRRGVARRLLRAALGQAAGRGARSAYLEVSEANGAALAFYGSEGFRPCGRRAGYYGDGPAGELRDALILMKVLDSVAG